jgi:hypothetical protein
MNYMSLSYSLHFRGTIHVLVAMHAISEHVISSKTQLILEKYVKMTMYENTTSDTCCTGHVAYEWQCDNFA